MDGYDEKLISLASPLNRGTFVPAMVFDTSYEVQARKINASKVNLGQLIKRAGTASGTADFSLSPGISLATYITYKPPQQTMKTFGHPLISIYQGTTLNGSAQIYPTHGGSVTLGRYVVQGEYDLQSYNGTSDYWAGHITDTNGTNTQVITFVADWLYADYLSQDTA